VQATGWSPSGAGAMDLGQGGELAEIQAELQAIKKALRDDSVYLGMRGETLSRYLLQHSEKENLLLSRQLHNGVLQSQAAPAPAVAPASSPISGASAASLVSAGVFSANGLAPTSGSRSAQQAFGSGGRPLPRPAPEGSAQAFDRDNLDAVLAHMCDYEAVPQESARAALALSKLVRADPALHLDDSRVLPQLQRLMVIHDGESQVQLAAMKVLLNCAYDPDTAIKRLSHPDLLLLVLKGMDASTAAKGLPPMASEAAARLIAAESCSEGEPASDGGPRRTVPKGAAEGLGALAGFFAAAIAGESACHRSVLQLARQLLENEVIAPATMADRFATSASTIAASKEGASAAWGWLSLARQLCDPKAYGLGDHLVQAGCLRVSAGLLEQHPKDASVQLKGIEAMSSIIGNRVRGLDCFAEVEGARLIELAMQTHPEDVTLQTKGLKALSCGIQWPQDLQERAGYSYTRGVDLTKQAMAAHGDSAELQTEALAALAGYLDKLHCVSEIKSSGGEGLVKAMMTRHGHVHGVTTWGKIVLDGLGSDRHWQPRATVA